jgi:hypothetical protein
MLDNNSIFVISKFILLDEYINLFQTNKLISKILFNNTPYHIKHEYALKHLKEYPPKMLELLNPIKLYKIPIFIINKYGWGDYIDYINIEYFNTSKIIRGIDKYNRPFISFLIDENRNIITTLFQRYTDDKYRWVSGGRTPLEMGTMVINFDEHYKETEELKIIIDFFNNY